MSFPGGGELLIVLVILLFLFGAARLPKLARSMGEAGKELREGLRKDEDQDDEAGTTTVGKTKRQA